MTTMAQRVAARHLMADGYFSVGEPQYFSFTVSKVWALLVALMKAVRALLLLTASVENIVRNVGENAVAEKSRREDFAALKAAEDLSLQRDSVESTMAVGENTATLSFDSKPRMVVGASKTDTGTPRWMANAILNTGTSWLKSLGAPLWAVRTCTTSMANVWITGPKTWSFGLRLNPKVSGFKTKWSGHGSC